MGFFEIFTGPAGWVYSSVIASIIASFMFLLNQYFKQCGVMMVILFRSFVFLTLLPAAFFVAPPTSKTFYLAITATALSGGIADIRFLNMAAKYGGGMVARLRPLVVFALFPLWFLFDFELFFKYLDSPLRSLAIVATLVACVFFAMRFKKCDVSNNALIDMLPCLLGYTIAGVAGKIAATNGDKTSILLYYPLIQSAIIPPIVILFRALKKQPIISKAIMSKALLGSSFLFALFWMSVIAFQVTAMMTIPNPAYFVAINQLTPVIISLIYFAIKHKEEGDVKAGFGIVLCAVILSLLAI